MSSLENKDNESPLQRRPLAEVVSVSIRTVLSNDSMYIAGIQSFMNWVQTYVDRFLDVYRIWRPVADISVKYTKFVYIALSDTLMWAHAHESAKKTWDENQDNGLRVQIYAYGKKMAAYLFEILKQCYEKAMLASDIKLEKEEKENIADRLDELFQKCV